MINIAKRAFEDLFKDLMDKYSAILILPVFSLVIGFLIWNIYLYSLGFIENDLIRSRFVFTGITFLLFSYLLLSFLSALLKIFSSLKERLHRQTPHIKAITEASPDHAHKKTTLFVILSVAWLFFYSMEIFPKLPLSIGGAQPRAMSLVANEDGMKRLNSLEIHAGEGATYQTQNVCIAYENAESVIILREDRILSIDKSMITGFSSLPGIKSALEKDCAVNVSHWIWLGFISGWEATFVVLYNSYIASPFHTKEMQMFFIQKN